MFSLSKSLEKLKSALEEEGLVKTKANKIKPVKKAAAENGEASYANKPKKVENLLVDKEVSFGLILNIC